jgi:hypothetical protein
VANLLLSSSQNLTILRVFRGLRPPSPDRPYVGFRKKPQRTSPSCFHCASTRAKTDVPVAWRSSAFSPAAGQRGCSNIAQRTAASNPSLPRLKYRCFAPARSMPLRSRTAHSCRSREPMVLHCSFQRVAIGALLSILKAGTTAERDIAAVHCNMMNSRCSHSATSQNYC